MRGGLRQLCIRDFLFFGWCVDTHVIDFPLHNMALLFVHSFGLVARGGLDRLLLGCIALISFDLRWTCCCVERDMVRSLDENKLLDELNRL